MISDDDGFCLKVILEDILKAILSWKSFWKSVRNLFKYPSFGWRAVRMWNQSFYQLLKVGGGWHMRRYDGTWRGYGRWSEIITSALLLFLNWDWEPSFTSLGFLEIHLLEQKYWILEIELQINSFVKDYDINGFCNHTLCLCRYFFAFRNPTHRYDDFLHCTK